MALNGFLYVHFNSANFRCLSFELLLAKVASSGKRAQLTLSCVSDQDRSQKFSEGVMCYQKGGVLLKRTLSFVLARLGRNVGGGSNPQAPPLARSLCQTYSLFM